MTGAATGNFASVMDGGTAPFASTGVRFLVFAARRFFYFLHFHSRSGFFSSAAYDNTHGILFFSLSIHFIAERGDIFSCRLYFTTLSIRDIPYWLAYAINPFIHIPAGTLKLISGF